jgi:hypothetical protein
MVREAVREIGVMLSRLAAAGLLILGVSSCATSLSSEEKKALIPLGPPVTVLTINSPCFLASHLESVFASQGFKAIYMGVTSHKLTNRSALFQIWTSGEGKYIAVIRNPVLRVTCIVSTGDSLGDVKGDGAGSRDPGST